MDLYRAMLGDCKRQLSFMELHKKYQIPRYEVMQFFWKLYSIQTEYYREEFISKEYLISEMMKHRVSKKFTAQEPILFFSDTHIKKGDCNPEYLRLVYLYALKNNISSIVILGDLLDGFCGYQVEVKKMKDQLHYFFNIFPKIEQIKTYVLFGNHDYTYYLNHFDLASALLKERPDFNILGQEISYIKYNKKILQLEHPIKKNQNPTLTCNANIYFKGHYHFERFYSQRNLFHLASLSDENAVVPFSIRNGPSFYILSPATVLGQKEITWFNLETLELNQSGVLKKRDLMIKPFDETL